jgi:hypothetical protein
LSPHVSDEEKNVFQHFLQEAADLYRKSLTGAQKPLERWEFCEATAERFFGHLMTSMFTKSRQFEHGGQTERQRVVKKMFDYLKHNVAKSVSLSSRYDYATRCRCFISSTLMLRPRRSVENLFDDRHLSTN